MGVNTNKRENYYTFFHSTLKSDNCHRSHHIEDDAAGARTKHSVYLNRSQISKEAKHIINVACNKSPPSPVLTFCYV